MSNKFIANFSSGMNEKSSPLLLKESECEKIINFNLDTTGALVGRNGYDVFATQPVTGKRVHGLFQYTNTSSSAETTQVMVVNNSGDTNAVIYYNNSGTWATSKTNDTAVATFTNFNRARFATFLDYLFRVNGVDVGFNPPKNKNTTTGGGAEPPPPRTSFFWCYYVGHYKRLV